MNKKEYIDWCDRNGYILATDWNHQTIRESDYYFLLNPKTDKFALIKFNNKNCDYQVLVSDWEDFNGYANKFHFETGGFWK